MKFKLFRQLEGMDCGPACIQMIAFHYGKCISLYRLRDLCNVTRLGVSGDDLVSGCTSIGLEAVPCMVEKEKTKILPLPTILHWRNTHFVVLYHLKHKADGIYYYIADPQYGKIVIKENEFYENWCGEESKGYAILIQKTEAFEKNKSENRTFKESFKHLFSPIYESIRHYKKKFIWVTLLSILVLITNWCMPFFLQQAVDKGIGTDNLSLVIMLMAGQFVCFIGFFIAGAINNILLTKIGFNVSIDLLTRFLHKIIKLPISFFDTRLNTDLLQRMEDLRKYRIF